VSYLIDTNVVSELRKGERANPLVVDWFRRHQPQELFLSVLTLGVQTPELTPRPGGTS